MLSTNISYMPKAKSDDHVTPKRVFVEAKEFFNIDLSVCFDPCPINYTKNGLKIKWQSFNFVNPPYSLLREFVYKALEESYRDNWSIMLLPAKTDQKWFHEIKNFKIHWFKGRLKFEGEKDSATQPHFLVFIK